MNVRIVPVLLALATLALPTAARANVVPTDVHTTTSIDECSSHGGSGQCTHLSDPGFVLLVWTGEAFATRYSLYRTDLGGTAPVGIVGPQATGEPVPTAFGFSNGYAKVGMCFAVTTDIGNTSSSLSQPFCITRPVARQPRQNLGKIVAAATAPIVPSNVHATTDVSECQQHAGNFNCAALQGGALELTVLVWSGEAAADRYTVYRRSRESVGRSDATIGVATVVGANTGKFDGAIPTAFSIARVLTGECFDVTETREGVESAPSAVICPSTSARSLTLQPLHVLTAVTSATSKCSAYHVLAQFTGSVSGPDAQGGLRVGYDSSSTPCTGDFNSTGRRVTAYVFRGGAFFDVTRFAGRNVLRAMLLLTVPGHTSAAQSQACAASISNGDAYWWNDQALEPGGFTEPANRLAGEVDVTPIVSAWVLGPDRGGAPNYGFVLDGAQTDPTGVTGSCVTTYQPALVVTFQ